MGHPAAAVAAVASLLASTWSANAFSRQQDIGRAHARARLVGEVLDKHGAPCAGAQVTLCSQPRLPIPELEDQDSIRVATRKTGRFAASIDPARTYSVWASWKTQDGQPRVSRLVECVREGDVVRLVEASRQPVGLELRVTGVHAWAAESLRLSVRDEAGSHVALELGSDKTARIPPLPGQNCWVEVRTSAGALIHERGVSLLAHLRRREQRESGEASLGIERMSIPPPERVRITVLDRDTREPIAGARIEYMPGTTPGQPGPVATSDSKGLAELMAPAVPPGQPRGLAALGYRFFVMAAGYAMTSFPPNQLDRTQRGEPVSVFLAKAADFEGRLVSAGKLDVTNVPVVYRFRGRQGMVRTDNQGVYRIPRMQSRRLRTITIVLPADACFRLLPAGRPEWLPTTLGIPVDWDRPRRGRNATVTTDLGALCAVDLDVRLDDGTPASQACVEVVRARRRRRAGARSPEPPPPLFCDRRGRCRLVLPAGSTGIALRSVDQVAFLTVDLAATRRYRNIAVTLEPLSTVTGKVVDPQGRPVSGARVKVASHGWDDTQPFARYLASHKLGYAVGTSDSRGKFSLRLVAMPKVTYVVWASIRTGARRVTSHQAQIELPFAPVELLVDVGRKR